MKKLLTFFVCILGSIVHLSANEASEESADMEKLEIDIDNVWKTKLRARALIKLDKMLDWAFPAKDRAYRLVMEQVGNHYVNNADEMLAFSKSFGYFSKKRPIISTVTNSKEDIILTCRLLEMTFENCKNEEFLEVAVGEILSKVLAYRNLEEGMLIPIPYVDDKKHAHLVSYRVDKIFNLWSGMPAFGLIANHPLVPSILLYRGTDLSLESKQGWASVLSDLDIQGPGLNAFLNAQEEIHKWLKKQSSYGTNAKVMGFSLGGVLSTYTIIHEHDLINAKGSMAFNPPGVSSAILRKWKEIEKKGEKNFKVFINHGDLIPKIGRLVGEAYELSLDFSLKPIDAHVRLMCSQPNIYQYAIDIDEENSLRR